jgi:hypothetical protein
MAWRRRARREDEGPGRAAEEAPLDGDAWEYLVEEGEPADDRLERRCNELGTDGWELLAVVPLSRSALGNNGRTTGVQLFFKRRL